MGRPRVLSLGFCGDLKGDLEQGTEVKGLGFWVVVLEKGIEVNKCVYDWE